MTNAAGQTVVYTRISDDRSDHTGVERQRADCVKLATQRGWSLDATADVYTDDGYSASKRASKPRPRFEAMLARIKHGDVARIVVWKVDRLYRTPRDLLRIIDLQQRGVKIVSVTGQDIDTGTDDGVLSAGIMSFVAQHEADGISARVTRQKQQRRAKGLPHGGRHAFGWQSTTIPHPDEADILRYTMTRVVRGASLKDIARDWTAHNLHNRVWGVTEVRRALTLLRHVGRIVHKGEMLLDADGNEVVAMRPVYAADRVTVVGMEPLPMIVPRELFDECRAVLASRATGVGVVRRRSWLTGVLFCGTCGAKLTHTPIGAKKRATWRCWFGSHSPTRPEGGCGNVSIGADPLEALLCDELFRYVDNDRLRKALVGRDDNGVSKVKRELASVQRKRQELVDAFVDGTQSGSAYRMASERLDERARTLTAALGRLTVHSPLEPYSTHGALRTAWPELTTDERRSIIGAVFGEVRVLPATRRGRNFDKTRIELGLRSLAGSE